MQDLPDQNQAASILGIVDNRIGILRDYLFANMDKYPEYKPYIQQFCDKIKKVMLTENPQDSKYTSYTVNKGKEIALCLRSRKTSQLHDINLIMYVVIHELAHVACPEIDHTPLFKKIFVFFLTISIQVGIYQKSNYHQQPAEYCGMTISENLVK